MIPFPHQTELGFTLIELMITLVIAAVVITVGVPSLTDFVAAQRVRTLASDLVSDMALARAEAIKESRQVFFERVAGATNTWKDGWRICVNLNGPPDSICDANEVRKVTTSVSGRTKICSTHSAFDTRIVFRPDGRVEGSAPVGSTAGIKVSDDNGDSDTVNDRIRLVFIGISGRASTEVQDNDPGNPTRGTACP